MYPAFTEYLDYLEFESGAAQSTHKKRRLSLSRFAEWLEGQNIETAEDLTRREIFGYVDYLVEEGYAYSTIIESDFTTISATLNHLDRENEISQNPMDRIERRAIRKRARKAMSESEKKNQQGPVDYLDKADVYELADHAPTPSDRNELLIKLLFWTGCRVSEALGINIGSDNTLDTEDSDIDTERPAITVYSPKTNESRVVSYPRSELNPLLRDWVTHGRLRYKCADETERLFIGRRGVLTRERVAKIVDMAAENMGIQEVKREAQNGNTYRRVTPHLLRHSHAMHYHNEEDVSLDTLKDHLGHSSISTTEDYYATGTAEKMVDTFGE